MRRLLVAINALLVCLILGLAFYWQPETQTAPPSGEPAQPGATAVPPAAKPTGGDFTLDGPAGPVSLHDFTGRLVVLEFGYTYCPDICPTSLAILADALKRLTPEELARVQPLFVSVDPGRDTVARLAEYTTFFHPSILGLTGNPERLKEIAGRYGAAFSRVDEASAASYVIDHTALTYLIDGRGRLLASLPYATSADQLLEAIRHHLSTNPRESAP